MTPAQQLLADPIMLDAIAALERQGFPIWADDPEITLARVQAALARLEGRLH